MVRHLVLGDGQIGSAIATVLKGDPWRPDRNEVTSLDPQKGISPTFHNPDVMHVCFPWTDGFIESVQDYQNEYRPTLTIIHSTVPVGTSKLLNAVHSPVTGRHPSLEKSILTFVKYFGGGVRAYAAAKMFEEVGVKTRVVVEQETTEAGKLWQTLQYGYLIALQKEGYKWMKAHGADPIIAYDEMNYSYSDGYGNMGLPYVLPVLKDMPGPIGGHCVIPNLDFTDSHMAQYLKGLNESY